MKKGTRAPLLQVPMWMARFSITKHRFVPSRLRQPLQAVNQWVGRREVQLPEGFSHSPAVWHRSLSSSQLSRQRLRMQGMTAPKARLPKTWTALGHAFPAPVALRVHFSSAQKARFWMFLADQKGPLAYLERKVDFPSGTIEHAFMTRHPKRSGDGPGLSNQAMTNAWTVYPALGVHRITLTAGLSAGSAVWPRLGFCPVDKAEWDKLRQIVLKNAKNLAKEVHQAFQRAYNRSLYMAVLCICTDDDPEGVFEVVDIDPRNEVKKALQLKHGLAGLLLAGGHWRGHLELSGYGGKRLEAYLAAKGLTVPEV